MICLCGIHNVMVKVQHRQRLPKYLFLFQGGHEFTLSESDTSSIAVVENKGKVKL